MKRFEIYKENEKKSTLSAVFSTFQYMHLVLNTFKKKSMIN